MGNKSWHSFLWLSIFCISFVGRITAHDAHQTRILVASPIRQKPAILREFLESLKKLDQKSCTLDYFFIDDNQNEESHHLLNQFALEHASKVTINMPSTQDTQPYICDEITHHWNEGLIWKVAAFKDLAIEHALEKEYDYIFLIDSDILLHPYTIEQLLSTRKEIVSNIFWTQWTPGSALLPQVWLSDYYTQYEKAINEEVSSDEAMHRHQRFIAKLRQPGLHEVGGLCACTLVSRQALQKGVRFKRIKNVNFQGEDRHFCIRAVALGFDLFVDTHYPAYHVYRDRDLAEIEGFRVLCRFLRNPQEKKHRLTLSMVVKNEADRYLKQVLKAAREYITDAVIIDDASTDDTVRVCQEALQGIPLRLIKNHESKFSNEVLLRKQQWEETIKTDPEWILALDADEIFEDAFKYKLPHMLDAPFDAYYFRLFDFWSETEYREDPNWQAHLSFRPFLIRYKPGIEYTWKEASQHCGRFPLNILEFPMCLSELRLKHYGYATEPDRLVKYERYNRLDPKALTEYKELYTSILDKNPHLIQWEE